MPYKDPEMARIGKSRSRGEPGSAEREAWNKKRRGKWNAAKNKRQNEARRRKRRQREKIAELLAKAEANAKAARYGIVGQMKPRRF